MVGWFQHDRKNLILIFITSKYFFSGTDAGLEEKESITRIKEHPSYQEVFL